MPLSIVIPGYMALSINTVLFDLNGTLACDGLIADATRERLITLGRTLSLYVMTADTHGTLDHALEGLPITARRVTKAAGSEEKVAFLRELGASETITVGNGRNDVAMLKAAALGIAILGPEGAASDAILAADIVFQDINDALDAVANPKRLIASLRA
ncbi:MAG: HAD hydrolase family protein [Anaerolineae bacterium]|nr:HAD hydrolase family protein [Anaerolineae bacterium]